MAAWLRNDTPRSYAATQLSRSEQPIARVAQAGQDVPLRGELPIEAAGKMHAVGRIERNDKAGRLGRAALQVFDKLQHADARGLLAAHHDGNNGQSHPRGSFPASLLTTVPAASRANGTTPYREVSSTTICFRDRFPMARHDSTRVTSQSLW